MHSYEFKLREIANHLAKAYDMPDDVSELIRQTMSDNENLQNIMKIFACIGMYLIVHKNDDTVNKIMASGKMPTNDALNKLFEDHLADCIKTANNKLELEHIVDSLLNKVGMDKAKEASDNIIKNLKEKLN